MWKLDAGVYKTFNFSDNPRMPQFQVGMNSINIFNHTIQEATGTAPYTVNSLSTVATSNDLGYDSGATASLGSMRQIRFELRILF